MIIKKIVHNKDLNCQEAINRVFSLTWPTSMQIYWNKKKRLHNKRVQLPQDCLGTPTWPPFHCFRNTNMAAVTSCQNALYYLKHDSGFEPRTTEEHSERDANPKPPARDCPKCRPLGHATTDVLGASLSRMVTIFKLLA